MAALHSQLSVPVTPLNKHCSTAETVCDTAKSASYPRRKFIRLHLLEHWCLARGRYGRPGDLCEAAQGSRRGVDMFLVKINSLKKKGWEVQLCKPSPVTLLFPFYYGRYSSFLQRKFNDFSSRKQQCKSKPSE